MKHRSLQALPLLLALVAQPGCSSSTGRDAAGEAPATVPGTPEPAAAGAAGALPDAAAAPLAAGTSSNGEVDPAIQLMLHVENTESLAGVSDWVRNAQQRGVQFDVLGLSAYEAFQGPADEWRTTLQALAQASDLAEYDQLRQDFGL